jgi:hypothetical protein
VFPSHEVARRPLEERRTGWSRRLTVQGRHTAAHPVAGPRLLSSVTVQMRDQRPGARVVLGSFSAVSCFSGRGISSALDRVLQPVSCVSLT